MKKKTEPGKCIPFDPWTSAEKIRLLSDILQTGSDVRLRVTGASMAPFLQSGSIVTLRRAPVDKLRAGDLILFCRPGETLKLHRLIAFRQKKRPLIDKTVFIAKGDGLDSPDGPVMGADYLAKAIRIESEDRGRILCRDLETPSSRIVNALRALYYRIKSFLIIRYMRFKTRRAPSRRADDPAAVCKSSKNDSAHFSF